MMNSSMNPARIKTTRAGALRNASRFLNLAIDVTIRTNRYDDEKMDAIAPSSERGSHTIF